ncbi:MAG: PqqD family protein [Monoglobales bacterium]
MKTKKGFMLRQTAGRNIVVAVGQASEEFNGLITLNETGAFLWKMLQEGTTYEDMLKALLDEYDVSEADAKAGMDAFLKSVRDAELIDE